MIYFFQPFLRKIKIMESGIIERSGNIWLVILAFVMGIWAGRVDKVDSERQTGHDSRTQMHLDMNLKLDNLWAEIKKLQVQLRQGITDSSVAPGSTKN